MPALSIPPPQSRITSRPPRRGRTAAPFSDRAPCRMVRLLTRMPSFSNSPRILSAPQVTLETADLIRVREGA